jgi:hypothetical protein
MTPARSRTREMAPRAFLERRRNFFRLVERRHGGGQEGEDIKR